LKRKPHIYSLLYLLFALLLVGCNAQKKQEKTEKLKNMPTKELLRNLEESKVNQDWLYAKGYTETTFKGETNSLKFNMRMRCDSATWISLSKMSVPAITSLISKDSAKFLVKVPPKQYLLADFDEINKMINSEIDYSLLEDFFLGNPVAFDTESDYKSSVDGQYYLLSSEKSKRIERLLEKGKDVKSDILYKCWLEPVHFKTSKVLIHLLDKETTLEVNYHNWEEFSGELFPMKSNMELITPTDTIRLEMDYSKVTFEGPLNMPFKITDSYDQIILGDTLNDSQ
jgi:hypothetical protein